MQNRNTSFQNSSRTLCVPMFKIVGRLTIPQLQFNDLHKFVTPLVYISLQHLSATPKLHWLKI